MAEKKVEKVNKQELVKMLAEKNQLTLKEAATHVNEVLDIMTDVLSQKQGISFVGFGSFTVTKRAARIGKNPATGEELKIPARNVIGFKPSIPLKEAVNKKATKKTKK